MKWNREQINNESFIDTFESGKYTLQGIVLKKENIFNFQKLFGDFDIELNIFENGKIIANEKLEGLNGNIKQATNVLNRMKNKYEVMYS